MYEYKKHFKNNNFLSLSKEQKEKRLYIELLNKLGNGINMHTIKNPRNLLFKSKTNLRDKINNIINSDKEKKDDLIIYIYDCDCFEVLKWFLIESYNIGLLINIHYNDEYIFRSCCKKGNYFLLTWFWNFSKQIKSPINIHVNDEEPFKSACINGFKLIAEWLWDLSVKNNSPIDIHVNNNNIFKDVCYYGFGCMVEWLYHFSHEIKSPIKIDDSFDELFILICGGNVEAAKKLSKISNYYKIKMDGDKIVPYIVPVSERCNNYSKKKLCLYNDNDKINI
jgi:hypothetical protein